MSIFKKKVKVLKTEPSELQQDTLPSKRTPEEDARLRQEVQDRIDNMKTEFEGRIQTMLDGIENTRKEYEKAFEPIRKLNEELTKEAIEVYGHTEEQLKDPEFQKRAKELVEMSEEEIDKRCMDPDFQDRYFDFFPKENQEMILKERALRDGDSEEQVEI